MVATGGIFILESSTLEAFYSLYIVLNQIIKQCALTLKTLSSNNQYNRDIMMRLGMIGTLRRLVMCRLWTFLVCVSISFCVAEMLFFVIYLVDRFPEKEHFFEKRGRYFYAAAVL